MTIKFGLTGSLASGKTTAGKIISKNKGPIFSADLVVKKLYRKYDFKKIISDKFNIKPKINFKKELFKKILQNKTNLLRLEKIIHPLVRKEMFKFIKKNKNHKFLFLEIPLLIESKLTKYFDKIIFVKSNKKIRMKRYLAKGGTSKLFKLLDTKQLKDTKKIKYCDYVIVNNNSLTALKKKLYNIIKNYE